MAGKRESGEAEATNQSRDLCSSSVPHRVLSHSSKQAALSRLAQMGSAVTVKPCNGTDSFLLAWLQLGLPLPTAGVRKKRLLESREGGSSFGWAFNPLSRALPTCMAPNSTPAHSKPQQPASLGSLKAALRSFPSPGTSCALFCLYKMINITAFT